MKQEYKIPLNYKSGTYNFKELSSNDEDTIILFLERTGVLTYFVPENETEIRLYNISENMIKNHLFATYGDNGKLKEMKIIQDDIEKLVFIYFSDHDKIKDIILNFSHCNADMISQKILRFNKKIARLFIEYFYDGEAVDIAAKIGTVDYMQKILSEYNNGLNAVNNSGNYPHANRIECDNHTLGIMLMCMPDDIRYDMFKLAVSEITCQIQRRVLNFIDKSENFKFISEEYD